MQITRLGPYEIGKPLGKGGMGSVFAATDTATGAQVAVKALTPHLAMADGFRERFEAEIESLKILRHEGIVRLFGYGEQDGVLFYSMELVEGISLEDELKAGRRFNWREVSNIAIQLSLALKHAHDHGIVHRDIKPANILLYDEDRVKLADFGIARLFGATQLTTAGGVLGTADYMSPEQADGRPVTARCDQYSLGGVMYALLTGRPPFRARNLPQMLQLQRFASPEPVRRYAPDTPEQLERVIMQLLAKNPSDRFPNTQVLARHLQAMVMALSRPAHDDFALADEQAAGGQSEALDEHLLAVDATQSEANVARPDLPASVAPLSPADLPQRPAASQDAATLAADEVLNNRPVGQAQPARVPRAEGALLRADERPAHFTTLAEEEARHRQEHQRSWITVVAQLALLAAVLAGMGALAIYLSRPPSADELYQTITSQVASEDDASLAEVSREIDEFLRRYRQDPRAAELTRYKQRISLDRLERQLQREARGAGARTLLPVEQVYLQAINAAQESPERSNVMLQSLIDLYEANAAAGVKHDASESANPSQEKDQETARTAAIVQLAKRRLSEQQSETLKHRAAQLAELRELLKTAERLAARDPQDAAAMYQAMITLYQGETWSDEVVSEARRRLAELDKNP